VSYAREVQETMSDFVATERVRVEYSLEELEDMEDSKAIIFREMSRQIRKGIIEIFDNQFNIAERVVTAFRDRKIINVMVVAKTQSGKTGSMYATIKYFLEEENIPVENIYIITGLSSREWKKQTKERLPNSISQDNVFHRNELAEFADKIKGKKNILIIMDEIQIAATDKQTIFKSFQRAEQSSKLTLYENDVKILEYSATPNGTIYDLERWGDASAKILANPGAGYVGSFDLYNQKRVRDCEELYTNDKSDTKKESEKKISNNIEKIKWDLEDNYPDNDQRYHLIRTRSGPAQAIIIANFKKIFGVKEYDYLLYDQHSGIKDINNILENKPVKHTFIFIKEMLRCAKTLSLKYIGICYERYTGEPDDSVIIQGFIGRLTGYKDNGVSICYTNIESIIKYENYWNSNFEEDVGWKSMTTKRDRNGVLKDSNTFNVIGHSTDDSDEGSTTDESTPIVEPTIVKCREHQAIRNYYKDVLQNKIKEKTGKNGSGPRKKTEDDKIDGFYHANIRGTKRVYSFDEIFRERRCNVVNGAGYICHPCYRDTSDPTTLEWWLIHYY
jgi:hypothetical protein